MGRAIGARGTARFALAFATLVFANVALIFVTRARSRTALETLREPNPALWWIVLGALAAAIYVPAASGIFRFSAIALHDLGIAAAGGLASVAWYELRKMLRRRKAA